MKRVAGHILPYIQALIVIIVATGLRQLLDPILEHHYPFLTCYLAVSFVVWRGTTGSSLFTAIGAGIVAFFFFLSPRFELAAPPIQDEVGMAGYFIISFAMVLFGHWGRRAERLARERAEEVLGTREALRESRERLRIIFDRAAVGIAEVEHLDGVTAVNDRMCEILGYDRDELLPLRLADLTFPPDRATSELGSTGLREGKHNRVAYDERFMQKDGSPIWVHVTISAIPEAEGLPRRFILTVEDISARKESEAALQRVMSDLREVDRKKDEYLAILAHELRNPIAAIGAAASLLTLPSVSQEKVEFAKHALGRRVHQLSTLIEDLLDVSRIARGKIELHKTHIDVASVIHAAVESTKAFFEERHHLFTMHLTDGLLVNGDPVRLEQVLSNLLNNAAKYTDPGGRIEVTTFAERGQAIIRVKDNGIGIDPELSSRIFDLFGQGEDSFARSPGGLGVGLTIAKRLVEMHQGALTVQSAGPGRGSEFTITLPLVHAAAQPARRREPIRVPPGLHVLIVEDHQDTALMTAALLESEGHHTEIAEDALNALRVSSQRRPDVILLDLGLPDMDGFQVAKELRRRGLTDTLIIAVTGYGQERDYQRSAAAGIDYHLIKPVEYQTLAPLLAQASPRLPEQRQQ